MCQWNSLSIPGGETVSSASSFYSGGRWMPDPWSGPGSIPYSPTPHHLVLLASPTTVASAGTENRAGTDLSRFAPVLTCYDSMNRIPVICSLGRHRAVVVPSFPPPEAGRLALKDLISPLGVAELLNPEPENSDSSFL